MNSQRLSITKQTIISLAVVLLVLAVLYLPVLKELAIDWGSNDNYSHGYFILPLSLYMAYSSRWHLAKTPLCPNNFGLPLLLSGLSLLIVAKIGTEFFLQRSSLIIVLAGLVLFLMGWSFLKALLAPILYLFFMIPLPAIIWNEIAFPMQLFGSFLTEHIVSLFGIPIFRQGNILHLATTTLEVVDACSGLRSLMTMFALAVALAILSSLPNWKKWLLFFSAAPIAVFANIVRLTATALLATKYGSQVAQGFLHDFSGLLVFAIGLGFLILTNKLLAKGSCRKVHEECDHPLSQKGLRCQ